MRDTHVKPLDALYETSDRSIIDDELNVNRDDFDDMTNALNESLVKALREAGY